MEIEENSNQVDRHISPEGRYLFRPRIETRKDRGLFQRPITGLEAAASSQPRYAGT